jgi:hypothetical protein
MIGITTEPARRAHHPSPSACLVAALLVAALLVGRAGAGESYYVIVFALQGEPNLPRHAHTFATFVRASGEGPNPNRYALEFHTISWYPASGAVRLARVLPERGVNLSLADTLRLAGLMRARVSRWGPFQVRRELYDRAVGQISCLQSGAMQYKALDGLRRGGSVSNCIHAVSDIDPDGGLLLTGTAYGEAASRLVVRHFRRWMVNLHLSHEWVCHRLGIASPPRLVARDYARQ